MLLTYLKTDKCPICGESTVIREEIDLCFDGSIRRHVNGGRWEKRTFLCGQEIEYIPNFREDKLSEHCKCKNDPILIKYNLRKQKLYNRLLEVIKEENLLSKNDTEDLIRRLKLKLK